MTLVLKPVEIYAKRLSEGRLGAIGIADGWKTQPLGDLIELLNGAPFDSSLFNRDGRGIPLIRIRDVGKNETETWFGGDFDEKYLVTPGDVLVGLDGDFRVAEWHGTEALLNQRVCKLVPKEDLLDKRFMLYHLSGWLDAIWEETSATTVKHLSSKTIQEIPFPVPPIEVQRRIVEALGDHLSKLDKALADVDAVYRSSSLLRISALETALKAGFPMVTLENMVVGSGYGTSAKCVAGGRGVPVARIPNLVNGTLDMTDEKRTQDLKVDLKNLMLAPGDLLVIRTNGSQNLVGTTAVVPENINASFASYLIRFQVDRSKVHPEWVHYMFGSLGVRKQIVELSASSAGQYNLGLSKLNSIKIPLPSIQDQEKILESSSHLTSRLDSVQREQQVLLSKIETLKKSILNKTYSGGLQNA